MLLQGNFGLELESQRITPAGDLALTPHPSQFGDKCKNPRITTDFAESQVEMITPPFGSVREAYTALQAIRAEVTDGIGAEMLWPLSMPPRLPDEDQIPIARFSNSAIGRNKETYRRGLALRYGKKMQMISGIHFNFSLSETLLDYLYAQFGDGSTKREFTDRSYFALARNFLRSRWLLIYLFGASPFCDPTYDTVIEKELDAIKTHCPCCCNAVKDLYRYTTSLRISRFGYSNTFQNSTNVYFNSLQEYTQKIQEMLNANILQTESEFYSSIRMKQNANKGETQLDALRKRGVQYIEVRMLDLDPFEEVGISLSQLYFLQVFMLYCLLEPSEKMTAGDLKNSNANHHLAALYGRKYGLMLHGYNDESILLKDYGEIIFQKLVVIAGLMDRNTENNLYGQSVQAEYAKIKEISLLPSSRIAQEMLENKESFLEFGLRQAVSHSLESAAAYASGNPDETYPFAQEASYGGKLC